MMTHEQLIAQLPPITLEEMESVKLMNRTDTKFVTTLPRLAALLQMAGDDYFIQDIRGERNMEYQTTYFDTPAFLMYSQHQHGHTGRQKLRFRTYVSSHLQFMEVKTKNNHGRTRKKRMAVSDTDLSTADKQAFLQQHLRCADERLIPTLTNRFRRITLVNRAKTERLTIDTCLNFLNEQTGRTRDMEQLVIIELKRDGLCPSPVLAMLRELRIKPHGFSKYCMGSALTDSRLPVNRFKPKLRSVERILSHQL